MIDALALTFEHSLALPVSLASALPAVTCAPLPDSFARSQSSFPSSSSCVCRVPARESKQSARHAHMLP
jgi:hypothetical protein